MKISHLLGISAALSSVFGATIPLASEPGRQQVLTLNHNGPLGGTSRQVQRQLQRTMLKAFRSTGKVVQRGTNMLAKLDAHGDHVSSTIGRKVATKMRHTKYPPHYDALLNPTILEQRIMERGVAMTH